MTLHVQNIPDIPEQTRAVAEMAFRKGNGYMQMRDKLGTVFADEQFVDLFPNVGQRAEAPWRLALVTVMQYAENLTDRQAAEAVRGRIDWKYALSLELSDGGFDASVLSEFRTRLVNQGAEGRLFEVMLTALQAHKLLKAGGKQRTDSTHVLAKVRELNRLEFVGESLRAALNALASTHPVWLKSIVPAEWFGRYSRPFSEYRLPHKEEERLALGEQIGRDGLTLLTAVYAPTAPAEGRQLPEVEFLRAAWVVQFYQEEEQLHWRRRGNLPPGERLFTSPYDPEARLSEKRGQAWVGYKVYVTEVCEDDAPHLITQIETALATQADIDGLETIQADLDAHDCLPNTQIVDSAFCSGRTLVDSRDTYGVDLLAPTRPDVSWQAQTEGAFDLSSFQIDFQQRRATCPQGQVSSAWTERTGTRGQPIIQTSFPTQTCRACPVKSRCTTSQTGRQLTFLPEPEFTALQQARQRQSTPEFQSVYRQRAGIEGTISQATRTLGLRQSRYIGLVKTHLQHLLTATALNLLRVIDWWSDNERSSTRVSAFARLAPT